MFWQEKHLTELSDEEWESLCDGCGKCCLNKLEDIDSGELWFTNVVCRFFDEEHCRCLDYPRRNIIVPECVVLDRHDLDTHMMPETCAYRLLSEGRPLPEWHPLVSGDPESVFLAGHSIRGRVVSEVEADDLEMHLIEWVR